ncbi:MAG TPA: hypothetical protein VGE37_17095, partial [Archangium sp.]
MRSFACLLLVAVSGCQCTNEVTVRGRDAGIDAGVIDAGAVDSGVDAGPVDAGPACVDGESCGDGGVCAGGSCCAAD